MTDHGDVDFEKIQIDIEAIVEAYRTHIMKPVQALAEAFVEALRPAMDEFVKMALELHAVVYQEYVSRGAIYGKTDEGFTRWLKELAEISRLEADAQRIRQRHEDLAAFRQSLLVAGLNRPGKT